MINYYLLQVLKSTDRCNHSRGKMRSRLSETRALGPNLITRWKSTTKPRHSRRFPWSQKYSRHILQFYRPSQWGGRQARPGAAARRRPKAQARLVAQWPNKINKKFKYQNIQLSPTASQDLVWAKDSKIRAYTPWSQEPKRTKTYFKQLNLKLLISNRPRKVSNLAIYRRTSPLTSIRPVKAILKIRRHLWSQVKWHKTTQRDSRKCRISLTKKSPRTNLSRTQ